MGIIIILGLLVPIRYQLSIISVSAITISVTVVITVSFCCTLGIVDRERAGHSAVVWDQWMWVYGGYQFPTVSSSSQDGSGDDNTAPQMIRYCIILGAHVVKTTTITMNAQVCWRIP